MKYFCQAVICLCLVTGCGKGPMEPADIDQAGPALRTALEAWRSGKSQQELAEQKPSIIMNEDDWRLDKRLVEFEMANEGSISGRQVVWKARIQLENKEGKREDVNAVYVIDTTPRIVIVRDLFASRGKR